MTWITGTNASDDAIAELATTAAYLAEAHTRMPAAELVPEVLGLHRAVHTILRGGRQRLGQTRELLRVDSALLAHACLLLGDLGQYEAARAYGSAALLCAQECRADEGLAWTAMSKTARWQERFAEAAGLAAVAHLLKGSLDGAAGQLAPVLELSPPLRIRTITGYLEAVGAMLAARRFAGSPIATGLIEQIGEFCSSAATTGKGA
jgi:hypothetical protein